MAKKKKTTKRPEHTSPSFDCTAYTDGGCNPRSGVGSFACVVVVRSGRLTHECSGFAHRATIGAMEMSGALSALVLTRGMGVTRIISDAQYVTNSLGDWIHGWHKSGRLWGVGKPLKNLEILQAIHAELRGREVVFSWVRGHSGNHYNEMCDAECGRQIRIGEKILALPEFSNKVATS